MRLHWAGITLTIECPLPYGRGSVLAFLIEVDHFTVRSRGRGRTRAGAADGRTSGASALGPWVPFG